MAYVHHSIHEILCSIYIDEQFFEELRKHWDDAWEKVNKDGEGNRDPSAYGRIPEPGRAPRGANRLARSQSGAEPYRVSGCKNKMNRISRKEHSLRGRRRHRGIGRTYGSEVARVCKRDPSLLLNASGCRRSHDFQFNHTCKDTSISYNSSLASRVSESDNSSQPHEPNDHCLDNVERLEYEGNLEIGSWNVQGVLEGTKRQVILKHMKEVVVEIVAIQETNVNTKSVENIEGHRFFFVPVSKTKTENLILNSRRRLLLK